MKVSVIDIGSNSVRLATFADGQILYKRLFTTRLGEGLAFSGMLKSEAIERTALAVKVCVDAAKREGAQKVYAFATAAVRSAENRDEFLNYVKNLCGLDIEVICGETEAEIALLGALGGKDGGVIDIGGASTEVTVKSGGELIFCKSANIGAVRLYDEAGRNRDKLEKIILQKLNEFGGFTAEKYDMYGVSGTATTLAALYHGQIEYDSDIVTGTVLSVETVENYADRLLNMSVETIREMLSVDIRRADIIGGGALFLAKLMRRLKISKITVSDSDNLEGFLTLKESGR